MLISAIKFYKVWLKKLFKVNKGIWKINLGNQLFPKLRTCLNINRLFAFNVHIYSSYANSISAAGLEYTRNESMAYFRYLVKCISSLHSQTLCMCFTKQQLSRVNILASFLKKMHFEISVIRALITSQCTVRCILASLPRSNLGCYIPVV